MGIFDDMHHIAELKEVVVKNNEILSSLITILQKLDKNISELSKSIKEK